MTSTVMQNRRGLVSRVLGYADALAARASDTVLLVGRLAMGIIFFQSGLAKLAALGAFSGSLGSRGVPFPGFWGPVGAISEFVGGTEWHTWHCLNTFAPFSTSCATPAPVEVQRIGKFRYTGGATSIIYFSFIR